ncbi:MAG: hypothetical protein ACLSXK_08740 [Lactococcus petauri]|uniref:hypothetical protein n=1 Tax=Lactococcus petauri TaxID=1940789 RepID=UPI0018AA6E09|nr:hypothetical protein [Lactococcus petauri]MDC0826555.1 hypothetical protein [Lactococcus petauri]
MSVKKFRKSKGYESLSREFLQRNDLSLEARGLLAYMESMPDDYVFHKTQLYKCFDKNKKTSVERIWNELLDQHFIIAFSRGSGPKQEFDYLFTHESFSEQDISELNNQYFAEGWEVAYRSGTNRKPASFYQEKPQNEENTKADKSSKHEGVENQHPDNNGISKGVDFEQHNLNSTKSTDNKLTNKSFILNGDEEEEKENKKEISKFEEIATKEIPEALKMIETISKEMANPEEAKNIIRFEVVESLASLPSSSQVNTWLSEAVSFSSENCQSYPHLAEYIAKNYKMRVQRWTVERTKTRLEEQNRENNNFHIPMNGPWNTK